MITEHFDMTLSEKLTLIGQVFLKIGWNFLPFILVAVVVGIVCHRQEQAGRNYKSRR
jgi:hypothetical protein